jgi:putative peptidoglycan lipid II flippase
LLAAEFGAGRELDIYYAAFQIPDFLSVLFLLGGASAAVLPIFQEYLAYDPERARSFIAHVTTTFFIGAFAVSLTALVVSPVLVSWIAPGFSDEERGLAITLTRIILASPILLGLSSIFSSVVQSYQRFFVYALAPVVYNVGIIVGIGVLAPLFGLVGLGMGVVLGAMLHLGVQVSSLWPLGFLPRMEIAKAWQDSRRVAALALPRVMALSLWQVTSLALVALASTLSAGAIAVFSLAQNLYYVPIGIFGLSYSIALFPQLNRAYLEKDGKKFLEELFLGIRTILFWIIPTITLAIVLRAHIVRVALGAGLFSWEDTRLTAASLAIFALSMGAGSLTFLLIRGFYALESTWPPLKINLLVSGATIGFAYVFTNALVPGTRGSSILGSALRVGDLGDIAVLGLVLAFALGLLINAQLLYVALVRQARIAFGERVAFPRGAVAKFILASLAAGGMAYVVRANFSATFPLISFMQVMIQGISAAAAGLGTYFVILTLLKSEDISALWRSMQRRLFKIGILPKGWDGEQQARI